MIEKEKEIDLIELSLNVWKGRWRIIKYGFIASVIGIIVAFSIPKEYQTIVKIAPENNKTTHSSPMGGLAQIAGIDMNSGNSTFGISEKIYPEIIKSTPFLLEFMNINVQKDGENIPFYDYIVKEQKQPWWRYITNAPAKFIEWIKGLFEDKQESDDTKIDLFKLTPKQHLYLESFGGRIYVDADKKTGILFITTLMQDPVVSAVIADSVLSKLQRYIIDYRTSKARANLSVTEKMLADAKQDYYKADSLYANAADRNKKLNTLSAKVVLDRLENEKNLTFSLYQKFAVQLGVDEVALQEDTPIASVIEPARVPILAVSPRKSVIVILFAFLGGFITIVSMIIKDFLKKDNTVLE